MESSLYVTDEEAYSTWYLYKAKFESSLVDRIRIVYNEDKPASPKKDESAVAKDEKRLLVSIDNEPNLPVTRRASILGESSYMMNKLKESLKQKGLAEQFSVNLGKQFGGTITLLALTEKGYEAIGKKPKIKKSRKNESHEHIWWKMNIDESYRKKSIPSEIEKSLNGKHADVGIVWKGENIAIEVELTPKNAIQNIKKDIEAGFDQVVSCAKNKTILNAIEKQFKALEDYESLKGQVKFRLLSDFDFVKEIGS